MEVTVTETSIL